MSANVAERLPPIAAAEGAIARQRVQGWRRAWWSLRGHSLALAGLFVLTIVIVVAVAGPAIAPYDPLRQERSERLLAPGTIGPRSGRVYVLGTDSLGRDVLSRLVAGARASLIIGTLSVLISAPLGVLLGLCSGYFSHWVDDAIMRIADVQLAFPFILLAMSIIAVLGPSMANLIIVLGISGWVLYARVVRSEVLSLSQQDFVQAARVMGCGHARILFRHILPNVLSPVIVLATFALAYMIILESSLSFLGLGIQPPAPSWGNMLNEGRDYISRAWWISVVPGLAIMVTVLSVNFVGDWMRDLLDPREQLL